MLKAHKLHFPQPVSLLHHTKSGGFLLLLWNAESETLSSSNHTKSLPLPLELGRQHIQPIGNKEKMKTHFDWSENFWTRQTEIISLLLPRKGDLLVSVLCGSHKNFKGPLIVKGRVWKMFNVQSHLSFLRLVNHTTFSETYLQDDISSFFWQCLDLYWGIFLPTVCTTLPGQSTYWGCAPVGTHWHMSCLSALSSRIYVPSASMTS
jgi:hypothetical protein